MRQGHKDGQQHSDLSAILLVVPFSHCVSSLPRLGCPNAPLLPVPLSLRRSQEHDEREYANRECIRPGRE